MGTESLSACLRQLGVDEISHLKCNSIRELHRFHVERGAPLDWKTIACQNNGLLLYAIASQFLNPRACYEELVACCEELLSFHSFVNIVMPIFLDEQLGGVNRVNQCFTFFFSTLRRDTPSADCDPSVYAWYECVVCYLPFSPSLLQQMQLFLRLFFVLFSAALYDSSRAEQRRLLSSNRSGSGRAVVNPPLSAERDSVCREGRLCVRPVAVCAEVHAGEE